MGKKQKPKAKIGKPILVLDTNVILHDGGCLEKFGKDDVMVPIAVIEELDGFKRGNAMLNVNAREFIRRLDAIAGDKLFNGGISIGKGKGRVSICLNEEFDPKIEREFSPEKPDHKILNTAYVLADEKGFERVILISKDTNLRMKAKSVGLKTRDYMSDHVVSPNKMYFGHRRIENFDPVLINRIYTKPYSIPLPKNFVSEAFFPNEYAVLCNGSSSAIGSYDACRKIIRLVEKKKCSGITPHNVEQTFALDALCKTEIPLVTIGGKAGTGKTILALAAALESKSIYRKIFLARPVVPLSNKDLGFLPGDISSKLDPYMQPLYDNLSVIENSISDRKQSIKEMLENEKIVITPLSYIRGRSIVKAFFIVDEAQNLTPHEVKTIITRAGEGTKIVFTGDINQIDHPYLDTRSNGLSYLIDRMKGEKIHAHVNLEKGERSELAEIASKLL